MGLLFSYNERGGLFMRGWVNDRYLLLLFAGLILGVVLVQTCQKSMLTGIFGTYFLSQYANLKIDTLRLLKYTGSYRAGQYLFVVCCGAMPMAPAVMGVLLLVLGMVMGTMLSISTIQLGIKGILICVAGVLPQIFFYLPAFGWVLLWITYHGNSRKKYLFLAAAGSLFLLFGILSETCINPPLLQQLLRKIS